MLKGRKESRLLAYFGDLPDPRIACCKRDQLIDSIVIGICAVICSADSYVEMEEFGESLRANGSRRFLIYPTGFPRMIPFAASSIASSRQSFSVVFWRG